nr:MAG TPA: hypothetical protein [Caudoviricetes sp.]
MKFNYNQSLIESFHKKTWRLLIYSPNKINGSCKI